MNSNSSDIKHQIVDSINCSQCAAVLKFNPGTTELKCSYCQAVNQIDVSAAVEVVENDFSEFASLYSSPDDLREIATVQCGGCGAATTLKENVTASECPFCGLALVVTSVSSSKQIKPSYILPFSIDQKTSFEKFKSWISSLWFAPSDLKKKVTDQDKLHGIYIPYWTYDSHTRSTYTGEKGVNYRVQESYNAVENGKTVLKTRTVTKTKWTPASGCVEQVFDDVLVAASNHLPPKHVRNLEPWDLKQLQNFNESFLVGFQAESYQITFKDGLELAKSIMSEGIKKTIHRDIGGDQQRIIEVRSDFNEVKFKHILLPLWISSFNYKGKVFRFMINARTGKVSGERPWSIGKIVSAAVAASVMVAVAIYFLQGS